MRPTPPIASTFRIGLLLSGGSNVIFEFWDNSRMQGRWILKWRRWAGRRVARGIAGKGNRGGSGFLEGIKTEISQNLSANSSVFRFDFPETEHFAGDEWIVSRQAGHINAWLCGICWFPIAEFRKPSVIAKRIHSVLQRSPFVETQPADCIFQSSSIFLRKSRIQCYFSCQKIDSAGLVWNGKGVCDDCSPFL